MIAFHCLDRDAFNLTTRFSLGLHVSSELSCILAVHTLAVRMQLREGHLQRNSGSHGGLLERQQSPASGEKEMERTFVLTQLA